MMIAQTTKRRSTWKSIRHLPQPCNNNKDFMQTAITRVAMVAKASSAMRPKPKRSAPQRAAEPQDDEDKAFFDAVMELGGDKSDLELLRGIDSGDRDEVEFDEGAESDRTVPTITESAERGLTQLLVETGR